MEILRRIVYLVFRPAAEWDLIAREPATVGALLQRYILPLALLAPIATVIGMKTFDRDWDPVHGYLVPPDQIVATGVTTYCAIIGSILALAAIFTLILPLFGGVRDYVGALKVAAYGAIPVLLAGATLLLPVLAIIGIIGMCHTLYLYWMGAGRVLKVPAGSEAEFVGIAIVLLTLFSALAGAIAGSIGLL
ncbi:MAG: Yip1 family protein [Betaproteobacteria bacterium]